MYQDIAIVEALRGISCLTLMPKKKNKPEQALVFRLGHTRISLVLEQRYIDYDGSTRVKMFWRLKRKYKGSFKIIKFLDVIEANFVSEEIKTELLFHLDLFVEKYKI